MKRVSGRCACHAIRYDCAAEPLLMVNCHCKDCQRSSGAPFASGVIVLSSALAVEGTPRVYEIAGEGGRIARRSFCPACGTPLFAWSSGSSAYLSIRAATLDDASWFHPQMDCFTRSAQPWVLLDPAIPKFETTPGAGA